MADVKHSLSSGQSLSVGWLGTPIISTVTEAANSRYATGTTMSTLVASGVQKHEVSMGYRLSQAYPAVTYAVSGHGVAGESIANLSKGGSTGAYEAATTRVTDMRTGRIAAGDTYAVTAFHFIQGERDQLDGTTQQHYIDLAVQMLTDLRADIAAIQGAAQTFPFILSQTSTWGRVSAPASIGLAQLRLAREMPGFYLACPQYQLPYNADNIHLTPAGYYYLGELHARAERKIIDTGTWKPVAPTGYTVVGNTIKVAYDVPVAPLVFDTTAIAAQPNMGYSLTGTLATITGVSITGPKEVTVTCNQPPTEPTTRLGYGVSSGLYSGLGNLRDSETAVSAYDAKPLPNWAVHSSDYLTGTNPVYLYATAAYMFTPTGLRKLTLGV